MGFVDNLNQEERAPTFTSLVQAPHETAESKHELHVDKSELVSKVDALLSSVGVAIDRLKDKGQLQSKMMSVLESVQSQATEVLSALEQPDSFRLAEFSKMAAAISSNLSYETDSTDNKDPDDSDWTKEKAKLTMMLTHRVDEKVVNADPLMVILTARAAELDTISASHAVLAEHAVISANDAKTDVNATIELASIRYAGASDADVDSFIAQTKKQMVADMQASGAYEGVPFTVLEANANERIDFIKKHSKLLDAALHQGGEATRISLLNAAEESIDMHARHLKAHGNHHFDTALVHLNGYMGEEEMDAFTRHAAGWDAQRHDAHHALKDKLQEMRASAPADSGPPQGDAKAYLDGLMQSSGISTVLDENIAHGQSHAESLSEGRAIFEKAYEQTLEARAGLNSALQAENHADITKIAKALGMDKAEVIHDIAQFQNANSVAFEQPSKLKTMIADINGAIYKGPVSSHPLPPHS